MNPLRLPRLFGQFIKSWAISAPWKQAWATVPALLALLLVGFFVFVRPDDGLGGEKRIYEEQYRKAVARGDYQRAELASLRLQDLDGTDRIYQLQYAKTLAQLGRDDEARRRMQQLVAENQYADAALWLLNDEFGTNEKMAAVSEDISGPAAQRYEYLLNLLHEQRPREQIFTNKLCDFRIAYGDRVGALELLEPLVSENPDRALQAASLYRAEGNKGASDFAAETALRLWNERLAINRDNPEILLRRSVVLMFMERFQEAAAGMRQAIKVSDNDERFRAFGAQILVRWDRRLQESANDGDAKMDDKTMIRRLSILKQAMLWSPRDPLVLSQLAETIIETSEAKEAKTQQLRKALLAGFTPTMSHFLLGTSAALKKEYDTAALHLDLAYEKMPQAPEMLNNLAVALAKKSQPDLKRALTLSDQAVQLSKRNNPLLLETRGQIYLQLGEYKKAILDLEAALTVEKVKVEVHRSLAIAYDALGDKTTSRMHSATATALEEKRNKNAN